MNRYTDEILYAIAHAIYDKCPDCPCSNDCNVDTDDDCLQRILNWLERIVLDIDWNKVFWDYMSEDIPQ